MLARNQDNSLPDARGESLAEAALQRNHSRARKARLLLAAVQQFCEIKRPTREDTEIFRELFYQLIEGCGKSDRRAISAALARNPYCPRPILIYLALESPDIAAPMLLFSEALNETDIVTLANRFPKEHLKILCRRQSLTETAARALARYGGVECAELLAKNTALLQPSPPPDPGQIPEVVQAVGPPAETANPLHERHESNLREEVVRLAGLGNRGGPKPPPGAIGTDNRTLATHLTLAARQGGPDALAREIEDHCHIPARTTKAIISRGTADSLAVLFRGLGIGAIAALQLILLVNGKGIHTRAEYDAVKAMIAGLAFEQCRVFLEELGARFEVEGAKPGTAAAPLRLGEAISQRRKAIAQHRETANRPSERQMREVG
jgi:hypothetical protein